MRLWPRLARSALRAASSEAGPNGRGSGTSRLRAVCLAGTPTNQHLLQAATGMFRGRSDFQFSSSCSRRMIAALRQRPTQAQSSAPAGCTTDGRSAWRANAPWQSVRVVSLTVHVDAQLAAQMAGYRRC